MEEWVKKIKDVGNDGADEPVWIDSALALSVAEFTEQLLILTYQMTRLAATGPPRQRPSPPTTS